MVKCWMYELHTEANLGLRKEKIWYLSIALLRVLLMTTLRFQVLQRVIHWVFHKENKLAQDKFLIEKCQEPHPELQIEANLVLMKDEGQLYQVDLLRVLVLVALRMGSNSLRTQNFYINWDNRVYLRQASKMICLKEVNMERLREGHLQSSCGQNLELRQASVMEFKTGGMLKSWRDQLRDRSEQQGVYSGPGGGP